MISTETTTKTKSKLQLLIEETKRPKMPKEDAILYIRGLLQQNKFKKADLALKKFKYVYGEEYDPMQNPSDIFNSNIIFEYEPQE